jgi:hypothetical protein
MTGIFREICRQSGADDGLNLPPDSLPQATTQIDSAAAPPPPVFAESKRDRRRATGEESGER